MALEWIADAKKMTVSEYMSQAWNLMTPIAKQTYFDTVLNLGAKIPLIKSRKK